jgi:DNA-binding XRE family transcriptional regulator/phage-related protein
LKNFETIFLEAAKEFIASLDKKSASKVFYNIDLAEQTNDTKIFKKLQGEIWEFRSKYLGNQHRFLAFWDKSDNKNTLVIATHGFIKKTSKVPKNEIQKLKTSELSILYQRNKSKMANKEIKTYSLAEMKDMYIGKQGTKDRDEYEYELRMDIIGKMIKQARQDRNLTQEQLGELIGVQKSQISKLESSANSATIDTVIKVFKALKAEINFRVKLENEFVKLV